MKRRGVLRELAENLRSKPATIRYPKERVPVPEGFRGRIEVADPLCIGCSKCAIVCPTECIDMVPGPRKVPFKGRTIDRKKRPEVHLYACIRCGLCEQFCPTDPKAIYLTADFAGSGSDKEVIVR